MFDEIRENRELTEQEILDYHKKNGMKTLLDMRIQDVKDNTYKIVLRSSGWHEYDDFLNIDVNDWQERKYFDDEGKISERISDIPNDKGGIYIYVVKPPVPIRYTPVIMYIGRAHNNGPSQNLRKRVKHYEKEADDLYRGRMTVRKLFHKYRDYLYVMYLPLENNDDIDRLERELITCLVPTDNKDLIQKSLKEGRSM